MQRFLPFRKSQRKADLQATETQAVTSIFFLKASTLKEAKNLQKRCVAIKICFKNARFSYSEKIHNIYLYILCLKISI